MQNSFEDLLKQATQTYSPPAAAASPPPNYDAILARMKAYSSSPKGKSTKWVSIIISIIVIGLLAYCCWSSYQPCSAVCKSANGVSGSGENLSGSGGSGSSGGDDEE